jgi:quercetin dioxygenase-like cupin family protein
LREEGVGHIYIWQDGPNASYPDHTPAGETAHLILNGEMTLTRNGKTETYGEGARLDVSAGAVHSVKMGRRACRYLVGER